MGSNAAIEDDASSFCLKWNDYASNLSVAFQDLRRLNDFFDVTLLTNDGAVQAHKVILWSVILVKYLSRNFGQKAFSLIFELCNNDTSILNISSPKSLNHSCRFFVLRFFQVCVNVLSDRRLVIDQCSFVLYLLPWNFLHSMPFTIDSKWWITGSCSRCLFGSRTGISSSFWLDWNKESVFLSLDAATL